MKETIPPFTDKSSKVLNLKCLYVHENGEFLFYTKLLNMIIRYLLEIITL